LRRLAALLAALAPLACARAEEPGAPPATMRNVLLFTWDTTRADHLGCYGWKEARTETLDRLAARGVLYEHAWSAVPITLASHTTILTGVYPCAHGIRDNAVFTVAPAARLVSEAFKDAGFRTAAFVGSFILDAKFGLDQGFDLYSGPDVSTMGRQYQLIERPAAAVAEQACTFLDSIQPKERFFVWIHFNDPHSPYEPPADLRVPGRSLYDGEIAECDRQLRRVLEKLEARGLAASTLVALTADHGEGLGEHGERTHGLLLHDATMHVPLILAPPPAGVAAGTRVTLPVSTADLAVTLLARAGLSRDALPDAKTPPLPDDDAAGEEAGRERALYLETFVPWCTHRWHPLQGLVWKGMKWVDAPKPELYSLDGDPRELANLAGLPERRELRDRLAARLAALVAENPPLHWDRAGAVSADDHSKLQALGYTSSTTLEIAAGQLDRLPDPKDHLGDLEKIDAVTTLLAEANALLRTVQLLDTGKPQPVTPEQRALAQKKLAEAREIVAALRKGSPDEPAADDLDSQIALALGDHAAAVAPLERCVAANPRFMTFHYNLANAYVMTGHVEWARREMGKAALLEPRSLRTLRWMVQFEVNQKSWPAAAWWADALLQCAGQTPVELENIRKARERIGGELEKSGAAPRAPEPLGEGDLQPEGLRDRKR
jgi:arylsulfatase A-like enzyme